MVRKNEVHINTVVANHSVWQIKQTQTLTALNGEPVKASKTGLIHSLFLIPFKNLAAAFWTWKNSETPKYNEVQ